ncbi:MAG: hypothetical protein A2508_02545 [Candidatus Lambdaproteobacteria bacterium RIFOXYD12_FULL_49_8]|uniref:Baseplate protein J-like barrel domain-containing protein n=1 Tax=Candidatus Lambdaproteobacteria bacterium RIFOXYD2_FULL_50_16 TaxID=1817772 RepID=A0A1F6G897_9PROT|nr:MAG: hypothetical protein A2527_00515 [Candidatus Lambdaproteobacteria bacterium RIFOXYD2_FULL_50_16]OGG98264.1 MAG: hypothetical protein A2508_02545 [Candidatus Lambdaproteobacteria bacterium RIFOXYD12_FULL_49_8]
MDQTTIDQMMVEISLADETALDQAFNDAAAGTRYAEAAKTKNSVLFNVFYALFREPFRIFREAVKNMLPQLFIGSASGTWLEQFAADYDLTRDQGVKARHLMNLTKTPGQSVQIAQGDIFYVNEAAPRGFLAVAATSIAPDDPNQFAITVEAEAIGTKYNVIAGQISETLVGGLNLSKITNVEILTTGREIETDEELRERIFAKKWSQNLQYGVDAKYLAALQSVAAVDHARLDSVVPDTGTLHYVVYGRGTLDPSEIALAQGALNQVLMTTDQAIVSGAESCLLTLGVVLHKTLDHPTVTNEIAAYFMQLERGTDFYSSLLSNWLYDRIPALSGTPIEINPDFAALPDSSFFYPSLTISEAP